MMQVYTTEMAMDERIHPLDAMRPTTVQAIAMLNLMLRHWNEPPLLGRLHSSTLVQQNLALIARHGGLTAKRGWTRLVASGVSAGIDQALYTAVLRRMGHPEVRLIEQSDDGALLPCQEGERVINDRGFYVVFMTPEEFKVVTDRGRNLGALPVDNPIMPEQLIIFAGRRWKVLEVESKRRDILVTQASGAKPPAFGGDGSPPADEVVAEMRRIYQDVAVPRFLDATAIELLTEARETFGYIGLREYNSRRHEDHILLFPWVGGRAQMALVLALAACDIHATSHGLAAVVPGKDRDLPRVDAMFSRNLGALEFHRESTRRAPFLSMDVDLRPKHNPDTAL
jgi:ATP-dependent Lhr-like helicase